MQIFCVLVSYFFIANNFMCTIFFFVTALIFNLHSFLYRFLVLQFVSHNIHRSPHHSNRTLFIHQSNCSLRHVIQQISIHQCRKQSSLSDQIPFLSILSITQIVDLLFFALFFSIIKKNRISTLEIRIKSINIWCLNRLFCVIFKSPLKVI